MIRRAEVEDIDAVALLWLKMVKELAPTFTPNLEWWKEMAVKLFDTEIYVSFVAEVDGEIVGFVDGFIFNEPSTGKIHGVGQHLYITPEYRNDIRTSLLLKYIMQAGKEAGATVFELFSFKEQEPLWIKKGFLPKRTLLRRIDYV